MSSLDRQNQYGDGSTSSIPPLVTDISEFLYLLPNYDIADARTAWGATSAGARLVTSSTGLSLCAWSPAGGAPARPVPSGALRPDHPVTTATVPGDTRDRIHKPIK